MMYEMILLLHIAHRDTSIGGLPPHGKGDLYGLFFKSCV